MKGRMTTAISLMTHHPDSMGEEERPGTHESQHHGPYYDDWLVALL
jgi:hypothetical protein